MLWPPNWHKDLPPRNLELSLGRISGLSAADPQLRLSLLLELVQAATPTQEKIHYIDYIPIVP